MVDIQRARILTAMAEVACTQGAANVTVAHVVKRAGVSRRTFYELFEDRDDCFLAALDHALECVCAGVLPAYEQPGSWKECIRAALSELLRFFDRQPFAGRMLIVEALAGGHAALERRARVLASLVQVVEAGGPQTGKPTRMARLTAEGVVGSVLSVIHARMLEGHVRPMVELLNPLMGMVVLPYLGPAAARRELDRRQPHTRDEPPASRSDVLRDLDIRLTYRTIRVLAAVAANPGGSNRAVGTEAEIGDQGQASRLLARLQRLGLVSNSGASLPRGAPNAWTLTTRGEEICGALVART